MVAWGRPPPKPFIEHLAADAEEPRVVEAHALALRAEVAQVEAKGFARSRGGARVVQRKRRRDVHHLGGVGGGVGGGAASDGVGDGRDRNEG